MKQNIVKQQEKIKRRVNKKRINLPLLLTVCVLLILGSLMIFSAGYPHAKLHYNDGFYYIKRHLVFLTIGVSVMALVSRIKIEFIKKISPFFYGFCMLLLVAVLFTGFSEGVAKRWLGIPGTPLSFQPSELMKLGIILMLSWYSDKTKLSKKTIFKGIILPGLILFSACALVLLEKHLSGTVILAMIGMSVLFISGINLRRAGIIYGGTGIFGAGVFLLTNSYAMKRIQSFFNPNADILSDKWQTTQGLYAIGSGGLWGLGYFNSRQKYSYVSEPQNDFIFTIWCEETGFVGAIVLVLVFLFFIWQGYKIAFNACDTYTTLVSFGIVSQIGIQAFLNMLVVLDVVPNTGISLPFFSYGGSSLVILLLEIGILLSISRNKDLRI